MTALAIPAMRGRSSVGPNDPAGAMLAYLQAMFADLGPSEERFHAIFLDGRRGYLGDRSMGRSDISSTAIRGRELFARALALGAHGLIIAHNHPSGNCHPSEADIRVTKRLKELGQALDIELLDHLIVTREKIYSMRAGGKL